MEPLTANTTPETGKSFTERYGGWILSACFHLALFSALLLVRQPRATPHARTAEPIRVMLADLPAPSVGLASPAPAIAPGEDSATAATAAPDASPLSPVPTGPAAPLVSIQPAEQLGKLPEPKPDLATQPEKSSDSPDSLVAAIKPLAMVTVPSPADTFRPLKDGAKSAGEGSGPYDPNLPFNPDAGGSTETGPASPDGTYAQGTRSKRGDGVGGEGTGYGRAGGSAAIGERISMARADLAAKKTLEAPQSLFSGRGASEGAIRVLDIGGTPGEKAREVMDRYGIKMLVAKADDPQSAGLGRKEDGQGQFVTKFGSGTVGIFRFSNIAASRMGQLEDEALRASGEDPEKTRIVRVVFGIVSTKNGYDLGVTDMRTEALVAPVTRRYERTQPGLEPAKPKKIRR